MKTDPEMTGEILRELHTRRAAQKKRRLALGTSAAALAVVVLAAGLVWGVHRKPADPIPGTSAATNPALGADDPAPIPGGTPETAPDGYGGAVAVTPAAQPAGEETTTTPATDEPLFETTVGVTSGAAATTAVPAIVYDTAGTSQAAQMPSTTQNCTTSNYLSGSSSYLYVLPEKPAREELERSGEKLTDKKAQRFFKENLPWLQRALSASGVPADALRISERGYSHVAFDNNTGAQYFAMTTDAGCVGGQMPVCALRQNFRDYPVWNGDELVAIVTLVLENGEIHANPAFGGTWFKDFGDFLNMHKGEKLLFLYFGGQTEFVLTPDGKVRNPQGQELVPDFGEIENPYEFFYCSEAVYVP